MDYRSNKILNQLLDGINISIQSLSEEFQISERMVKKIIKDLNGELASHQIPEIQYNSKGHIERYVITEKSYKKIQQFITENDYYTYHLTTSERKTIMAMIMLNHQGYITAAALSEYLQISRNTVLNDMNELKEWFSNHKITLCSQVQKGYQVKGNESDIRKGILKLVQLNYDLGYKNEIVMEVFHHLLLRELQYEERMPIIYKILREEEEKQDLYFSDFSFTEVANELLIILDRVTIGKILPPNIVDEDIKNSSKYPFSSAIMRRLEEEYQIAIPEVEKNHYVQNLRKKSYIKSSTTNVDEIAIPIMIGETIHRICRHFNLSFYLDFSLYDVLVDHMRSIVYRSRAGEFLPNPFGNEMKERYPEIFFAVKENVKSLERYIGFSFLEDEISFLVMYFAAMLERNRQERMKDQKVAVALVGNMGRGVMNYICTELKKLDDIITIQKTCSAHEICNISEEEIDMIVSYAPLRSKGEIPFVRIDRPILGEEEIFKIRMTAVGILDRKVHEFENLKKDSRRFSASMKVEYTKDSLITEKMILLDIKAAGWEEAIRVCGQLLYREGAVTEEYIDAMIENVKINGTYIVIYPGLAIPHAEKERGAMKEAVSLVRLQKPVYFGSERNDPVSYVIGMSVLNSDRINQMIYNLIHMFSDDKFLSTMNRADTSEEMYQLIRDKI